MHTERKAALVLESAVGSARIESGKLLYLSLKFPVGLVEEVLERKDSHDHEIGLKLTESAETYRHLTEIQRWLRLIQVEMQQDNRVYTIPL